jgi:hypothetical protein
MVQMSCRAFLTHMCEDTVLNWRVAGQANAARNQRVRAPGRTSVEDEKSGKRSLSRATYKLSLLGTHKWHEINDLGSLMACLSSS